MNKQAQGPDLDSTSFHGGALFCLRKVRKRMLPLDLSRHGSFRLPAVSFRLSSSRPLDPTRCQAARLEVVNVTPV